MNDDREIYHFDRNRKQLTKLISQPAHNQK
jgi:hypothetical protein